MTYIIAIARKIKHCIWIMVFVSYAKAQVNTVENVQKMSDQKSYTMQLDSAIALTTSTQYKEADIKYVQLLNMLKSVPSELVFYFGKNSYFLNKYEQSVDWLNKYIQLKGKQGSHYREAMDIKARAEKELVKNQKVENKRTKATLLQHSYLDCEDTEKIICPVCDGSTVVIRQKYTEKVFQTCVHCDEHGLISCEKYNELINKKFNN